MSYFITAKEAMQEYGIREAQLAEIVDSGEVIPYDSTGRELSVEQLHKIITMEYYNATKFFVEQANRVGIYTFDEQTSKMLSDNAVEAAKLKAVKHLSFVRTELESTLSQIFPEIFSYYKERKSRTLSTISADFDATQSDIPLPDSAIPVPTGTDLPLPLPPIKKSVSREGQGKEQVQNTLRDNKEAVAYVHHRLEQGVPRNDIAKELKQAGGGDGVIGCIFKPDSVNITAARDHGKYLLKKG